MCWPGSHPGTETQLQVLVGGLELESVEDGEVEVGGEGGDDGEDQQDGQQLGAACVDLPLSSHNTEPHCAMLDCKKTCIHYVCVCCLSGDAEQGEGGHEARHDGAGDGESGQHPAA